MCESRTAIKRIIAFVFGLFAIMSTEASFLEYWPSCIAAAAILCAAGEIPNLSLVISPEHAESWCDGLHKVCTHVIVVIICICLKKPVYTNSEYIKINFFRRKSSDATG